MKTVLSLILFVILVVGVSLASIVYVSKLQVARFATELMEVRANFAVLNQKVNDLAQHKAESL
jgi:hypothetical protein